MEKKPKITQVVTSDKPVDKKAVEETTAAVKSGAAGAKKTKDGGVVIATNKEARSGAPKYDVVIRGGQAVKVESTDEPDLD